MSSNLTKAKALFESGSYTCTAVNGETVYTSKESGVKPLIGWIESNISFDGFSFADKIVGKAAAYLYVLLKAESVYAPVMSEKAVEVFKSYGIEYSYDVSVTDIINRQNTGICPMEDAVQNTSEPKEALAAINLRIAELKGMSGNS